jgi:ribonuclease HI
MFVVAVGDKRGVYATLEEANEAAGDNPLRLVVPRKTAAEAVHYSRKFDDVKAVIYTDGACTGNGKPGARAGVGVFWGVDDPRNVSRPVHGLPTNNVAELEAIEDAVDAILADDILRTEPVVIVSDSKYGIDCLTTWYDGFVRRKWLTTSRTSVLNRELIERIHDKLTPNIRLAHVRGHTVHEGNNWADKLAGAALRI